jgi:hypothetical protein
VLFIRKDKSYKLLTTGIWVRGGGWLLVSPELETKLLTLLPYVVLTLDGDVIVGVEDDVGARNNPPKPEPDRIDDLAQTQLALAELAETQEANNLTLQLAIAELAEALLGG